MTEASDLETRLAGLRGSLKTKRPNARSVAASLDSPGRGRRAILDAARVDKGALARLLGYPLRDEQSPFALRRGNLFEEIVTRDGCAHLLAQLRERLGLEVPHARFKDLSVSAAGTSGDKELRLRAAETRAALRRLGDGDDSVDPTLASIARRQIDIALSLLGIPPVADATSLMPENSEIDVLGRSGPPWTVLAPVARVLHTVSAGGLEALAFRQLIPDESLRWRLFHLGVLGVLLRTLRERGMHVTGLRPLSGSTSDRP